jgi:NADH-quinone oxidoreductase subunit E
VSLRRLAEHQPGSFAFTAENLAWCEKTIQKYPLGREASAVIPILWRGQEQEGWVTKPMIESVAQMLGMAYIRVLEVATFYTMFNLHPVGEHHIYVCTTTPCWLKGSDEVVAACKRCISPHQNTLSADGKFSWMEMECLGACVNAPMIQVGSDVYEDLDGPKTEAIIEALRRSESPKTGPQNGRHSSEPFDGPTTLKDPQLYTGGYSQKPPRADTVEAKDVAAKAPAPPADVRESPKGTET